MDLRYLYNEWVWRWEKELQLSGPGLESVMTIEWTSMGLKSSHGAGGKETSEGRDNRFLNLGTYT